MPHRAGANTVPKGDSFGLPTEARSPPPVPWWPCLCSSSSLWLRMPNFRRWTHGPCTLFVRVHGRSALEGRLSGGGQEDGDKLKSQKESRDVGMGPRRKVNCSPLGSPGVDPHPCGQAAPLCSFQGTIPDPHGPSMDVSFEQSASQCVEIVFNPVACSGMFHEQTSPVHEAL